MTLVSLQTAIGWPGNCQRIGGVPAINSDQTLSASGHYQSWVGAAREAMTISHIGFRVATVANSPTAEVRVETVAADGTPSGTLFNSGTTNNSNGTTGVLTSNSWTLQALTGAPVVPAGSMFALLVKWGGVATSTIQVARLSNLNGSPLGLPYEVTNVGGSAVKIPASGTKLIVAGSGLTTFYSLLNSGAANSVAANAFNNTNSAAKGLRFQVPFKCRAVGIRHYQGAANGDYGVALYDDSNNILSSSDTAYDGNYSAESATAVSVSYFDSPVTLSTGTWYTAALVPSSATNINCYTATMQSSAYLTGWAGGANQGFATLASGTWTTTGAGFADTIPFMDIMIDQVDDGTGSGGAAVGVIGG